MTNGQANQEMVELVERLRQAANGFFPASNLGDYGVCDEAASAIETLLKQQEENGWQLIEEMRWPIEKPVIVSDGLNVYGAGWWHPGEQAWLDCGGICPTHWQPLPEPPAFLTKPALEDKYQPEQQGGGLA